MGDGPMRAKSVVVCLVALGLLGMVSCLSGPPKNAQGQEHPASSRVLAERLGLPAENKPASTPSDKTPPAPKAETPPKQEQAYPLLELELVTFDDVPVSLESLKGRWVLLDFFTTYAIPSQTAMPVLDRIGRAFRERGLVVVGISLDMQGAVMVEPFIEALDIRYPIYLARGETLTGRTPYGFVQEIPATLLIAPDGHLVKGYLGGAAEKELEKDLKKLLK